MQNEFQNVFLQHVILVNLGRRHADTFLKNLPRIGWQAARDLTANIRHVPEHRGIADQPTVFENRP